MGQDKTKKKAELAATQQEAVNPLRNVEAAAIESLVGCFGHQTFVLCGEALAKPKNSSARRSVAERGPDISAKVWMPDKDSNLD